MRALLDSGAPVVTLVAKSDVRHVERALRTTLEENLAMVADTVRLPGGHTAAGCSWTASTSSTGTRVDRDYGVRVAEAAVTAGADVVVLCDTNGGMLPMGVERIVARGRASAPASGSASTARTTPAARWRTPWPRSQAGATHVQCTANGYGERAGNADLFAVVGNLMTKMGLPVLPEGALADMMRVSHALAELANIAPEHPPGLRRLVGVLAQGRPARVGDQGRPATCTTTSTRPWSATTCTS